MPFQPGSSVPGARRLAAVLLVCSSAACGGRIAAPDPAIPAPPAAEPEAVAAACAVGPASANGRTQAADSRPVVLGLSGPVDAQHAPVPRTPAERLVFAQLYPTLVRVDCEGVAHPWLAESWSSSDGGREWTFRLRPDLRDWQDHPVDATAVGASWSRNRTLEANASAPPGAPVIEQLSLGDAVTLTVRLSREVGVGVFASPRFAVGIGTAYAGWPVGSGEYRPALDAAPGAPATGIRLLGPATLEVRTLTGDLRDALDAGVDLMITMDPAVIDYAEAAPSLETVPLTWDRTYALLAPAGAANGGAEPRPAPLLPGVPEPALTALARDAVRVEARAAATPSAGCLAVGSGAPAPVGTRAPRIVYPAGDPVARSLAERLVALALGAARPEAAWLRESVPDVASAGARVSAVGLAPAAFQGALSAGRDAAYVLPVDRTEGADPCALVAAAVGRAPWLQAGAVAPAGRGPVLLPLVDARSTLVLRRGIVGLYLDGNDVLRLEHIVRVPAEPRP